MKYHCAYCNYIYNEFLWEEELNINKITLFQKLPDYFCCPNCWWIKDDFIQLKEEILYPFDIHNLTLLESIHFPKYKIKNDIIKIEVNDHISEEDHFIYKIWIYEPNWEIIEEKTLIYNKKNTIKFDLDYIDEFEIRVHCSKDWIFSTWLIKK